MLCNITSRRVSENVPLKTGKNYKSRVYEAMIVMRPDDIKKIKLIGNIPNRNRASLITILPVIILFICKEQAACF